MLTYLTRTVSTSIRVHSQSKIFRCLSKLKPKTVNEVSKHDFCSHDQLCQTINSEQIKVDPSYEVYSKEFSTKPFGKIVFRTDNLINVDLSPLDPQTYPLANKLLVTLWSSVKNTPDNSLGDILTFQQSDNTLVISSRECPQDTKQINLLCSVNVPVKFDVEAELKGDRSFSIEKLEIEDLKVETEQGDCRLKSIQGGEIDIKTLGGNVRCESLLQGNTRISTEASGYVEAHRVQGLTFDVQTEAGDIKIKALYADDSNFTSNTGDVHITSCHRKSTISIKEKGGVEIGSLDGDLNVTTKEGDIDVLVSRHGSIQLHTNSGDISLKLPGNICTRTTLQADDIMLVDEFESCDLSEQTLDKSVIITGTLEGADSLANEHTSTEQDSGARMLEAKTDNGNIRVLCQDWLSSLNIGLFKEEES